MMNIKMLFIGLLIILLNLFSLSGALAETISRSPRDSDYFLFIGIVSLCVGVIGFSNYLTLNQIWGGDKFYDNMVFQFIGWSSLVTIFWGGSKILESF